MPMLRNIQEILLEKLDDLVGHMVILEEPGTLPSTLHYFPSTYGKTPNINPSRL
jgi:hypothetical protein